MNKLHDQQQQEAVHATACCFMGQIASVHQVERAAARVSGSRWQWMKGGSKGIQLGRGPLLLNGRPCVQVECTRMGLELAAYKEPYAYMHLGKEPPLLALLVDKGKKKRTTFGAQVGRSQKKAAAAAAHTRHFSQSHTHPLTSQHCRSHTLCSRPGWSTPWKCPCRTVHNGCGGCDCLTI